MDHTSKIFHGKNYCKHLCKSTFALFATFEFEQPRVFSVLHFKLAYFRRNEYLLHRTSASANVDIIAFLKHPGVTLLTGVSVWVQSVLADSQAAIKTCDHMTLSPLSTPEDLDR